ncbi:MAG: hypothetical protein WD425_00205 [Nitrospirales bacterium]
MMQRSKYTSMTEALKGLKARGFTTNFEFLNNTFCVVDSGRTFKAEELSILEHHRFEGVSDPDDESILYAIETSDGIRGAIADAYGVYSNPELEAFMEKVKICDAQ